MRPASLSLHAATALALLGCEVLPLVQDPIDARHHAASTGVGGEGLPPPRLAGREVGSESPRSPCLLVLLPGIGDRASSFERHGFFEEAEREGLECDLVAVDAHFTYYLTQTVVERLATDVLVDARRRGYEAIWLVGLSLGGYGAMLTAQAHPTLVDGVVLLAPMMGVPPNEAHVALEIEEAGGLHAWPGLSRPVVAPLHHFRDPRLVWDWLRSASLDPAAGPRLVLGYGDGDRRAGRYAIMVEALPPGSVYRVEGAHDWVTWGRLWREVLRDAPWRRSAASARLALGSGRTPGPGRSP